MRIHIYAYTYIKPCDGEQEQIQANISLARVKKSQESVDM